MGTSFQFPGTGTLRQDLYRALIHISLTPLESAFIDELARKLGRFNYDEDQILVSFAAARDFVQQQHNDPRFQMNIEIAVGLLDYMKTSNPNASDALAAKMFITL